MLWAFERHLDGRRDHALYLGVIAALMRPEAWPFLGLYGLWLWFTDPHLRKQLVAFAVLIPSVWFLPEWWGSGDPLRAGSRANAPNPGSAAFDDIPAFAVAHRFVQVTIAPVSSARSSRSATRPSYGAATAPSWRRSRSRSWGSPGSWSWRP